VPEKTFQYGLDRVGSPEHLFDPRPPAAETQDHEVADGCLPGALPVDDDGHTTLEVRLADEELAAAGELANG
jgi:hypothetical protein